MPPSPTIEYTIIQEMKRTHLFNGQRRPENPLVLSDLTKVLRREHLIGMTEIPTNPNEPDFYPKSPEYFINGRGLRNLATGQFYLRVNGQPMNLAEITLIDPVGAQALIDAAPVAAAGEPVPELLFPGNEAARRLAYRDYCDDQKTKNRVWTETQGRVTKFFEKTDDHCDEVGRRVYEAFLPTRNSIGDPLGAWNALVIAMGVNAATDLEPVLTQWFGIKLTQEMTLPSYFNEQEIQERIMASMGHPLDPNIIKAQISKRIRYWQCSTTTPYQGTLDALIPNPAMTVMDFRTSLIRKEQDMLNHWPRTSSGRRSDKDAGKRGGQDRARITEYDSNEEDETVRQVQDPPKGFTGKCGICKEKGHQSKQCPDGWKCDKCKWTHHKNDPCDNGASKAAWMKAFAEKKAGGQVLKAGGGGGPIPPKGNRN